MMQQPLMQKINAALDALAPRERRWLLAAGALLLLALLWWVAIQPALTTYRNSNDAHAAIDAKIAQMHTLAQEAKALQAAPRIDPSQSKAWLESASKRLGKASVNAQSNRIQINFSGASPEALAAYLADARTAAGLRPVQANWRLAGAAAGSGSGSGAGAGAASKSPLWDGTLVFEIAP